MNFTPLYSGGLCEAVSIRAPRAPLSTTDHAVTGVGRSRSGRTASNPAAVSSSASDSANPSPRLAGVVADDHLAAFVVAGRDEVGRDCPADDPAGGRP
jgi:hypothetical protein